MRIIHVRCAIPTHSGREKEFRKFTVEMDGDVSVLDVLDHIALYLDTEITCYSFCRQGLCGGCLVTLNGKRVLACKTLALDEMTIDPIPTRLEENRLVSSRQTDDPSEEKVNGQQTNGH